MLLHRIQPPLRAAITSFSRNGALIKSQKCLNEAFAQLNLSLPTSVVAPNRQVFVRYAQHSAQGSVQGKTNGPGKALGAKKSGGQYVIPGNIIFRQRGTHWFPGDNCDMGRDHTIYATESGYVRYYKDPERHPKRQYIGVVFEQDQVLPFPRNAKRKRRLGMVTQQRKVLAEMETMEPSPVTSGVENSSDVPPPPPLVVAGADTQIKMCVTEVTLRGRKGEGGTRVLKLRPGYMWRESNWEIGRAAERAKVNVKPYKRGDRWTAWQKSGARKKINLEKKSMGKALKKRKKKKVSTPIAKPS